MKPRLNKGFSLLEVAIALLILSTSVIAIYQVISSTTSSIY
jgi:prepilin-type N-terminal cleavage/methylation domain-containing protein